MLNTIGFNIHNKNQTNNTVRVVPMNVNEPITNNSLYIVGYFNCPYSPIKKLPLVQLYVY